MTKQIGKNMRASINKKKYKQKKSIKQLLNSIWSNIKFLRILSVIATVISLTLGCKELYYIVDDYKTDKLITKLENSSLELNKGDKDFCRNWLKDVESLKDKPKFKETYCYLKGLGLVLVFDKDPLYNTELPPNYYLRNVSSESPYYGDAIIFRSMDIMKNTPDSLKKFQLNDLIVELEKSNYKTPRYYFLKYVHAVNSKKLDTLVKYYNELRTRYFDKKNYNNDYVNDVIKSKDSKISDLNQVQTLEYLYHIEFLKAIRSQRSIIKTHNETYIREIENLELGCKRYLFAINKLPDDQLGFLRGGFSAFQLNNPLFPLNLHIKLFFNDSEWFKYQRVYLDKFINLKD